ncbi:hypothetical protein SVIOM342S_07230 [Streptomyces violaceorubidus]
MLRWRAGPAEVAAPAAVEVVPDARRVEDAPGDEVHQVLDVRRPRVEGREAGTTLAPASSSVTRCRSVRPSSGVSRTATTSVRRSLRVTLAVRWSRSFDSPRATPATQAVDAGTISMPFVGYDPEDGPAARSPALQCRTRSPSRSTSKVPGLPSAPRASHSRRSCCQWASRKEMPVSSSRVSREARLTTRSTLSPAASSARSTAAAYGVPDAPDIPTIQGTRCVCPGFMMPSLVAGSGLSDREAPYEQIQQRAHEQGDADEAVDREERPVEAGQVGGADDGVLVEERARDDQQAEPEETPASVATAIRNRAVVIVWQTRSPRLAVVCR